MKELTKEKREAWKKEQRKEYKKEKQTAQKEERKEWSLIFFSQTSKQTI